MPNNETVRLRFAPSPTGDVHVGSIWLAQFNWLFAKQHGGRFIVRIEDTDQKRFVEGSVEKIYQALDWYGLTPDEGPQHGGDYGPYVQSQRLEIYHQHVEKLLQAGSAYYCFCTPERLEKLRSDQEAQKLPPRYDKHCAALPQDEAARRVAAGERSVVRLNVPVTGTVTLDDIIRGQVTFSYDQTDDSILLKSDGFPTYHLAVVVDDHLMKITHVLRAEEWLPSTPKHLLLYAAFKWTPPIFAHLPQILGPNKKKLSKRDGAASALYFRDQGYLPEAMQNFLALMGWHPKGDEEVLSREHILKQFTLADINPSGAVFDQTKLDWMNGAYIRSLSTEELLRRTKPFWTIPSADKVTDAWLLNVLALIRERMKTLRDVNDINTVFVSTWDTQRASFDTSLLIPKKTTAEDMQRHLQKGTSWLENYAGEWSAVAIKEAMLAAIAKAGQKNGDVLWPMRVALSLQAASPDVFDLFVLLGREESIRRLKSFLLT